jgi:chemotaxis protein histidine kinase CheA
MTEMFYDESSGILRDMRKSLLIRTKDNAYNQEVVQELFRGVHTLKADSAMMLYENMAELSKALEGLLFCFRGEGKEVKDAKRFAQVVSRYLDFFEDETDKLARGKMPDGNAQELEQEIRKFTTEITGQMQAGEKEAYQKEMAKPRRQIFYIAATGESGDAQSGEPFDKESFDAKAEEQAYTKRKKQYMISDEGRNRILQASRELQLISDKMEYSLLSDFSESQPMMEKYIRKLRRVQRELDKVKREFVNTSFIPVAKKMEIVVDEMSEALHKPVKLSVKGADTLVDEEKREKISSALIHVIRNAVDHGIEDSDTRERYGKSPMGLIKLRFTTEDGILKISVKDDGAGIDADRILESARQNGLLEKPKEEYTEKEVYSLMLVNGVTTRQKANEYSGRGVGMDVINHNVTELGGRLKISSKKGIGTTITMKF